MKKYIFFKSKFGNVCYLNKYLGLKKIFIYKLMDTKLKYIYIKKKNSVDNFLIQ